MSRKWAMSLMLGRTEGQLVTVQGVAHLVQELANQGARFTQVHFGVLLLGHLEAGDESGQGNHRLLDQVLRLRSQWNVRSHRLPVPDPSAEQVGELLEELCPLMLEVRTDLDLDRYQAREDDHVDGPVAVRGLSPPIHDFRLARFILEQLHDLRRERVLPVPVELADDPHTRQVLDALQPRASVAVELLEN